jgi:protein-S-isoprenylcysteine O-methyltransferase Ste14
MSLVPTFEIGVWNAWIFMAVWLFTNAADPNWLFRRGSFKALYKKSSVTPSMTRTEKGLFVLSIVIQVSLLVYSIFLPLRLGTAWFYTGLAVSLLGLAVWEIAGVSWTSGAIDAPVTRGIYRYSRHPMYIAIILQYFGAGIASASWLFLVLVIIYEFLILALVNSEERYCLEQYGDTYREYLDRTPKWVGLPKQ